MAKRVEPKLYCVRCMQLLKHPLEKCPVCHTNNATVANEPFMLPERSVLAGKYLVGSMLGQGGFGITYIELDLNLEVKVAIKEYYPADCVCREQTGCGTIRVFDQNRAEDFSHGRDRFLLEARVLARMDYCEGVVHVRDVFGANGTAYIVMDFVEGKTLKKMIAEAGGKLPASTVLPVLMPVIRSMEQVHRQKVLHRDISPDNIMITPQGKAVLLDFGAARYYSEEHLEDTKSVNVKHGYAPLEQYDRHGKQGPWTDVYAMCATIYKAITGVTPPSAIRLMMQHEELTPPTALGADLTREQEDALLKGLAGNKVQRIGDMDTLYHALGGDELAPPEVNGYAEQPSPADTPVEQTLQEKPKRSLALWKPIAGLTICAALLLGAFCTVPSLRQAVLVNAALIGTSSPAATSTPAPSKAPAETTASSNTPTPTATPTPRPTPTVRVTATPAPEIITSANDPFAYRNDQENLLSVCAYTGSDAQVSVPLFFGHYLVHGVAANFSSASPKAAQWTSVKLPRTVVRIEDGAFSQCVKLKTVTSGNDIEYVGKAAFEGTAWLTTLRKQAASGRVIALGGTLLDVTNTCGPTLTIGESITHIGHDALQGNPSVECIRVISQATIEAGAFGGCPSLQQIEVLADCELLGNPFDEQTVALAVEVKTSEQKSAWEAFLPKDSTIQVVP